MKKFLVLFTFIVFAFSAISAQTAEQTPKPVPKQIIGGVINGKAVSLPKPEYPAAAKAVKASGAVNIQVVVDETGNVASAEAVSGHPLLRSAAQNAALQAKFSPTILSGQPVRVSGIIVYNFVLPKQEGYEKELKFMGIGAFTKLAETTPNQEWENINQAELASEGEIADTLTPLASITKETPIEVRVEILRKVSAALETKLTGDDAWQFSYGRSFADFVTALTKMETENSFDEPAIKSALAKLKEFSASAPKSFPPEVLTKLKSLADFADVENLSAPENLVKLLESMKDVLQTISPDENK